jgi:hypothetical protein
MTDTPMTPEDRSMTTEEVVARIHKGWGVSYANLTYAALSEYDRAERLAALVAELEPDAKRLDWLEANGAFGFFMEETVVDLWVVDLPRGSYPTLRAAVDEAADRLADKEGA